MADERFEGTGPVARYWLANCEGFAVRGGVQGTVEELLRDADPFVTSRLVVRRGRRRTVVPVEAVAVVIPAERTVLVERRRKARPATARTVTAAATARRTLASAVPPARSAVTRTGTRVAAGTTTAVAATTRTVASAGPPARSAVVGVRRRVRPLLHATRAIAGYAAVVLLQSFRSLAGELRGRPTRSP